MENDTEGLDTAYGNPDGLFQKDRTLYIAGTRNQGHVKEWWKIPAFKVQDSDIYTKTNKDKYLQSHPEVNNLVGHSYGGSVALQLQKDKRKYDTTTYGAPVFDPIPRNPFHRPRRYCNAFDPVCIADMGAEKKTYVSPFNPNPQSYKNTTTTQKMVMPKHYHNQKMMRHATRLRAPFL